MRRPGRVRSGGRVELASVAAARRGIQEADVVALLLDATEGATDLDAAIGGEAHDAGRGILILVNKWDLVKTSEPDFAKTFDEELRRKMKFLDYAPVLHVSALTGHRTAKILEVIDKITSARRIRIPTPVLNRFLETVTAAHPPVSPERRNVRILYAAQTGVAPPSFVLFTNVATTLHFSYERYLVNKLREQFGFLGTPVRIQVRRRSKRSSGKRA
jgi:GTP-binding protein